MFEGDSADMCAGTFPLVSMGGQAEGFACADPAAMTPIGTSGNFDASADHVAAHSIPISLSISEIL